MDDLRAVMDEVGSDRAVIYGASESAMLDLFSRRPIRSARRRS